MNSAKRILLLAVVLSAMLAQAGSLVVTNFADELSSKTGWTAVQGGDSGYDVDGDPWGKEGGDGAHHTVITAASQRQATPATPVTFDGSMTNLTFSTRVMLHNVIAAVNEAVARVGMVVSGSSPEVGQLNQFWLTLRRVGFIELAVTRYIDGAGTTEYIVNTGAFVDTVGHGLSGYEYADWTVTRDAGGLWTVDAQNAYGETAVHFSAQESTVATSISVNRIYMQDIAGNWSAGEAAVYWDNVSVVSHFAPPQGTVIVVQ